MIFDKFFESVDDFKDIMTSPSSLEKFAFIGVIATGVTSAIATKKAIDILHERKEPKHIVEVEEEIISDGQIISVPKIEEEHKEGVLPQKDICLKIAACYAPVVGIGLLTMLLMHKTVITSFETIDILSESLNDALARTNKYKQLAAGAIATDISANMLKRDQESDDNVNEDGEKKYWFYLSGFDDKSDRYFKDTMSGITEAMYKLNRYFILHGSATVNDFCTIEEIESAPEFKLWGWSYELGTDYGYEWIDYYLKPIKYNDEEEGYEIVFPFEPLFAVEFDESYWDFVNEYHEHR